MKFLKEFLANETGRKILCIFGYEINKFIDYSYIDKDDIIRAATYKYN